MNDVFRHSRSHAGLNEPGSNGIDPDSLLSQFTGPNLGHSNDTCLAGHIICLTKITMVSHHGCGIQYNAVPLLYHDTRRSLSREVGSAEIHIEHSIKLIRIQFFQSRISQDTGVIDQNVQLPKFTHNIIKQNNDTFLITDIGFMENCIFTQFICTIPACCIIEFRNDHRCAFTNKLSGCSFTNTPSGTGDNGSLFYQ